MKKLLLAGTALGLVMSVAAFAGGPDTMSQTMAPAPVMSDWYAGVEGGVAFPSGDYSNNVKTGYDAGVHAGYDFGNDFKAELQYQFINSALNAKALKPLQERSNNWYSNVVTINGLYDFHMLGFDPYVGVGLGVNIWDASGHIVGIGGREGTTTNFAYQFIAGTEYKFASNIGLYLDYHFVGTDTDGDSGIYNNLINLGLNYYF